MPTWFLFVFLAIAVVAAVIRVTGSRRRTGTSRAAWIDLVLVALGGLGLAYHCGAMFYTSHLGGALGLGGYAHTINALGTGSIVGFSVPAVLLLVGARSAPPLYVLAVAVVLAGVGVTMYDNGPLDDHLTAIMVAAVVIIGGVVLLLRLPGNLVASRVRE